MTVSAEPPRWPGRLLEATATLRGSSASETVRRAALQEAWLILQSALVRFARAHAPRVGGQPSREDIEDLASEKALELARRLESGAWDPSGHGPHEIAGFLGTVARNGLVDLFRRRGKHVELHDEETEVTTMHARVDETAGARVESRAFAGALRDCAATLKERDRSVWFFRVFYELPSREIAAHPEIRLKAPHVDVILQRCRRVIRDCMTKKGHEVTELPPGTFVHLWEMLRMPKEGTR
jgi:RNA polymerase sigma factor (sigma-70 family)